MDAQTVATLFGLALAGGVVGLITTLFVPRANDLLVRWATPVAGAVAWGAMLGSLYFSEVEEFIPCKLCWYQRIAMYPLALLLLLAFIWRDRSIFRYVIPLAAIGLAISAYHVWVQWNPEKSNFCEFDNPCSAKWVEAFGSVTIPQMAGVSFILIIATGVIALRDKTQQNG